jgi:hypothetical protein
MWWWSLEKWSGLGPQGAVEPLEKKGIVESARNIWSRTVRSFSSAGNSLTFLLWMIGWTGCDLAIKEHCVWEGARHGRRAIRLIRGNWSYWIAVYQIQGVPWHVQFNYQSSFIIKLHLSWDTLNLIHSDSVTPMNSSEPFWAGGVINEDCRRPIVTKALKNFMLCFRSSGMWHCAVGERFLTFLRHVVPSSPTAKTWILNCTAVRT